MKTFNETYADHDFQRHLDRARTGWMAQVPPAHQPDLRVEGLRGSLFARVVSALCGRQKSG